MIIKPNHKNKVPAEPLVLRAASEEVNLRPDETNVSMPLITMLRHLERGAYDLQKLRIQSGNRLVANFKAKLGQAPSEREVDVLDEKGLQTLAALREMWGAGKMGRAVATMGQAKQAELAKPDPEDDPENPLMPDEEGEDSEALEVEEASAGNTDAVKKKNNNTALTNKLTKFLHSEHSRMTDKRKRRLTKVVFEKEFKGHPLISEYTEFSLLNQFLAISTNEEVAFKQLEELLVGIPVYDEWLSKVHGCGPAISAFLLCEIDIRKATYPSSVWKYAGLDVVSKVDNLGRSKQMDHLEDREYTTRAGETKTRKSITFKDTLKSKLIGVLAGCLIKAANAKYVNCFYNYKHRMEHSAMWGAQNDKKPSATFLQKQKQKEGYTGIDRWMSSPARRLAQAKRYMIKRFLVDLYINWRKAEGLPVSEEYSAAKLGRIHHDSDNFSEFDRYPGQHPYRKTKAKAVKMSPAVLSAAG